MNNHYEQSPEQSLVCVWGMNEFVILNLREVTTKSEDLLTSVKNTLNNMGIIEDIDVEHVYRRGPPRSDPNDSPRPVIVWLHRRDIVEKILKATRTRKYDRSNPRVVPHLPEQLRQNRLKLGMIAHQKYVADNNAKIKVKNDHVEVNGKKVSDTMKPATPSQILFLDYE